jgi:hypothetical protein
MLTTNETEPTPRVWTAAEVAEAFEHGYGAGHRDGALGVCGEIEAEMGPVGRFIDRLQERWAFLR